MRRWWIASKCKGYFLKVKVGHFAVKNSSRKRPLAKRDREPVIRLWLSGGQVRDRAVTLVAVEKVATIHGAHPTAPSSPRTRKSSEFIGKVGIWGLPRVTLDLVAQDDSQ